MIVNYHFKYLFVHIQKTAGTSISDILCSQAHTKLLFNHHTLMKQVTLNNEQNSLFKFAFVRNPWDRLYSWYNMSLHKGPINKFHAYTLTNSISFSQFLDCIDIIDDDTDASDKSVPNYKSISFNQLDYITDKAGNINVDYIGRFESIKQDFTYVSEKLGLGKVDLPHLNHYSHADYRLKYTDKDIEKVAVMYKRDIDYFDYKF